MYGYPYGNSQQMNLNWIVNEIINLHKHLDPDYETPSFSQIYPYSNLNQLNLDWILSELKALKELAPEPAPPAPAIDIEAVAEALVALPFDSSKSYQIYDYISRDGEIWRATEAIPAGGDWDETKWFKTTLGTDLAVLDRWINTINNSLTAEIQARQDADTALQNTINGLTSADISDDSDAGGATVKASLNNLNNKQDALTFPLDLSLGGTGGTNTITAKQNLLLGALRISEIQISANQITEINVQGGTRAMLVIPAMGLYLISSRSSGVGGLVTVGTISATPDLTLTGGNFAITAVNNSTQNYAAYCIDFTNHAIS